MKLTHRFAELTPEKQTPFVEIRRPLEMLEFREPYRIGGVQSFGDEWVFRRIMSAPGRGRVLSSNEKSPPLLGLMHTSSRREYAASVKGGGASEIRTRGTVKVPVVSYVCSDFRLRAVFASLLCCWSRCMLHSHRSRVVAPVSRNTWRRRLNDDDAPVVLAP
jgi:hypothetical protein